MDNNFNNQQGMPQQNFQQPMQGQPMMQGMPQNMNMQGGYYQPQFSARRLKTNRSTVSVILYTILTCGIYNLIFYNGIGDDINFVASKRDGKKTMNYILLYFIVGPLTCEIATIVWFHNISQRIGDEARARGVDTSFGAGTFWIWNVLGALILVGPFVYIYKLCKTMNKICEDYNNRGY
ncbi:MAG: DUF4234 domain-containing protein [Lachnospira sp.]|nr:DUF4234 domain-containing protein [Lachnospira sp.]